MLDFLNDVSTWSILKWVLLVLLAGFIGQFGKTMAQAIMAKVRARRTRSMMETRDEPAQPGGAAPPVNDLPVPPSVPSPDKKTLKIVAKAQKKAAKKGGHL